MTKPTTVQKFLALCSLLPKLADYIEELNDVNMFKQNIRREANMLVKTIRATDNRFFWRDGFEAELTEKEFQERIAGVGDQQWTTGKAFDNWIATEFFKLNDGEALHSSGKVLYNSTAENQEGHVYASARRNANMLKRRNARVQKTTRKSLLVSDEEQD
jgi:hypothetical protein